MTTHQITQFIKQNLHLKAHPFLHMLTFYKRIFILRYNLFEHLKTFMEKAYNSVKITRTVESHIAYISVKINA